jgi:hypothetical protein
MPPVETTPPVPIAPPAPIFATSGLLLLLLSQATQPVNANASAIVEILRSFMVHFLL